MNDKKETGTVQDMTEEKVIPMVSKTATENNDENIIRLSKPYTFEGKEYTEIALDKLDSMTIEDAIQIQKELMSEREVAATLMAELSTAFTRKVATKASGLPEEFFKTAPISVSRQVRNGVVRRMVPGDATENHVMKLEKSFYFEGNTYESIDLSGIANLSSLNESEAENRMSIEGIVTADTSTNYLYICCIASMGTGLPERLFRSLPFTEVMKLKNAVNDPDFFG